MNGIRHEGVVEMTRITRSGTYTIDHPIEMVFEVLTDPEQVVRCIPDSSTIEDHGETRVEATVKTGTQAVSVRLDLRVRLEEANRDTWTIRYVGTGSGPRSHVSFSGEFQLQALDAGTEVEWEGMVEIHGLLVALGGQTGRYEPIIDKKITAAIDNVQSRVMTHD